MADGSKATTPNSATKAKPKKAPVGPKTLDMVVEAITTINDRKGASIQAIKTFILEKYPNVDQTRLRSSLKKAVQKGMESGIFVRPKAADTAGASLTGRLKVDKAKLAAQQKDKKPKKPAAKATAAKPKKSPKKALTAKKSPAAKKTEKPKAKTLKKTDKTKSAKTAGAKTKATKPKAAKATKPKEPKTPKKPKAPKTPAKMKGARKTK